MSQPSYEILRVTKDEGAIIYASGAYTFATGATGVGGVHRTAASANNWNNVRFLHVASKVDNLPTSLVPNFTPGAKEFVGSTGTILGGSTPIGDLRGEGTGFVGIGTNQILIQKDSTYSGALYAIYEGAGSTQLTGKIGIGTTAGDISTSGYYESTFKTKNVNEFETVFSVDTGDLAKITTGSGVYLNDTVTLTSQIVNRQGSLLTTSAEIVADPLISGQKISILNIDGGVVFNDYKITSSPSFTFTRQDNIDVFGSHTRNFGIRTEIVNNGGGSHKTDFFLYGNSLSLQEVYVQASGVSRLNQSTGNLSINTGSITSAADRAIALQGFSQQTLSNTGVSGFIDFQLFFDQDPSYTNYANLDVYVSNTGTGFNLTQGNFLGNFPLDQTQGQHIRLFPNDFGNYNKSDIDLSQDLYFKFRTESNVFLDSQIFSVGPYRIESIPFGDELYLGNAGGSVSSTDRTDSTDAKLIVDDGFDGGTIFANTYSGSGVSGRITDPFGKIYLISGEGGTAEADNLQTVTDRGATTNNSILVSGTISGNTGLFPNKVGIGTPSVPTDTTFSVVSAGSTAASFTVRNGVGGDKGFVGIGTPDPQFPLDGSNLAKANIGAARSKINSTGSAIMGGADHHISGDFNMIAGGVFNNISGNNFSFIGGGSGIDITGSKFSTSVGGDNNDIFLGTGHFLGGGRNNLITGAKLAATIVGGDQNKIFGGNSNFIGGGDRNIITGSRDGATLVGGTNNQVSATLGFVGAGGTNVVHGPPQGGAILGGVGNSVSGAYSSSIGGFSNAVSGDYSIVGGYKAQIPDGVDGATVLADGQNRDHISSGSNTITLDFAGGLHVPTSGMFAQGLFVSGVPVLTGENNPAEADTLQTVTTRGNTTSTSILSTGPHISGVTGLYSDKVGIGTTTPNVPFEIKGSVGTELFGINTTTHGNFRMAPATADSRTAMKISSDNGALDLKFISSSNRIYFGGEGGSQKVGINTVNPTEILDVRGDALLSGDVTVADGKDIFLDGHNSQIQFDTTSNFIDKSSDSNMRIRVTDNSATLRHELLGSREHDMFYRWFQGPSAGALNEIMTLSASGRLRIGQDTDGSVPLTTLDVRGDISGSGSFLGTGVGNRITNNGTPYLLSGDVAAEADTLQTVTTRGNTTSTSILSTGPHISGVTGLFSNRLHVGTPIGTHDCAIEAAHGSRQLIVSDTTSVAAGVGGKVDFFGAYTIGGARTLFGSIQAKKTNASAGHYGGGLALSTRVNGGGAATERLTILEGGNVGIGTVSPDATLQIKAGDTTGFLVQSSSDKNILWAEDTESVNVRQTLNVYHTTVASRYLQLGWGSVFANDNDNELSLGSNFSSASATRILLAAESADNIPPNTIQMQANHGLAIFSGSSSNTFEPTALIDVRGDGFISGSVKGTGAGNRITNNHIPYLLSGDSPAETQTLQDVCDNGNTTTTDVNISGALTLRRSQYIKWDDGGVGRFIMRLADDNDFEFRNPVGDLLLQHDVSSYNVGIGTDSPSTKFHLGTGIARFQNAGSNYIEVDGSVAGANIARISSRFNRFEIVTNAGAGDPDISLMPAAGGNVGIGNNAPAQALSISTAAEAKDNNIDFLVANSNNAGLLFRDPGGGRGSIISNTDNDLIFSTNGTGVSAETMRIQDDGKVGIGTASAAATLDVKADTDTTVIFGRTKIGSYVSDNSYISHFDNGSSANYALKQNSVGTTALNAKAGQNVSLNVNNSEILFVKGSNSNVGIQTTSPTTELAVAGTISGVSGQFDQGLFISGVPVSTGSAAEADTLATVTARGNTTSTSILSTGPHISGGTGLFEDVLAKGAFGIHGWQGDPDTHMKGFGDRIVFTAGGLSFADFSEGSQDLIHFNGNENQDIDFRVGYNGGPSIFSRGSDGKVGIANSNPQQALDVSGSGVFSEKVGIGTNNPSGKLEINTSLSSSATLDMFQSVVTSYPSNTFLKGAYIELTDDSNAGGCSVFGIDVDVSHAKNHGSNRIYGVHSVLDGTAANNQYAGYFQAPTANGYLGEHGDSAVVLINAKRSDGGAVGDILRVEDSDVAKFTIVDGGDVYVSGKVGLNTEAPDGKLTSFVSSTRRIDLHAGSLGADLSVICDNSSNPAVLIKGVGTADLLNVFDNTTEVFTIKDGGNVGIGTAAPTTELAVAGTISGVSGQFDQGLFISGVPVSTGSAAEADTLQTVTDRGATTTNDITIANLLVDDDGEVKANGNGHLVLGNTNGGKILISGNTSESHISPVSNDLYIQTSRDGDDIFFRGGAAGLETMRLDVSAQSVGIGGVSPSSPLHVESSEDVLIRAVSTDGGAGIAIADHGSASETANVIRVESNDIAFKTNNSEKVRITAAGKVGIGTAIPTFAAGGGIQILAPTQANVRLSDSSDASYNLDLAMNNDDFFIINRSSGGHLKFRVNDSTEAITVLQDGKVGIGTTAPSDALSVNGHFSATSKSFLIDHPIKENKKLQYASLEGPENGVYVRGTSNSAKIELPDYWSELVHEDSITVSLTALGKKQDLFVKSKSPEFIIVGGVGGSYDYVVYGERKDIDKLETEPLKV